MEFPTASPEFAKFARDEQSFLASQFNRTRASQWRELICKMSKVLRIREEAHGSLEEVLGIQEELRGIQEELLWLFDEKHWQYPQSLFSDNWKQCMLIKENQYMLKRKQLYQSETALAQSEAALAQSEAALAQSEAALAQSEAASYQSEAALRDLTYASLGGKEGALGTAHKDLGVFPAFRTPKAGRRGRGERKNAAYWRERDRDGLEADPYDDRECLCADRSGRIIAPALANLDTGLKVSTGMIMSSLYAKTIGRYDDISTDFEEPNLTSISGHHTPVEGILRDVYFRPKGSSVTLRGDFFVCGAINGLVDIMFGAHFLKDNLCLFFKKAKESFVSMFAPWFSARKASFKERSEQKKREVQAKIEADKLEIARLKKEITRLQAAQGPGVDSGIGL
ncbi:metalloprotease [Elasticomyces elasticus]|nr:metalloprotease [Elasticomyces elasticus]KAK3664654.1 metalloprotease [Elasticomyces elasticus]KAK4904262.1 metalloprotease [Elasticomyces elasticus]KAK5760364.1 metalloprotease [Elasticomyces elasticus]